MDLLALSCTGGQKSRVKGKGDENAMINDVGPVAGRLRFEHATGWLENCIVQSSA